MDELLGRKMPHSVEAEQAVLGSMLIDPRSITDVIGDLNPEDFYLNVNRNIYETIYTMFSYSRIIDPVTVLDQMKVNGVYDEASSPQYIFELMNITPTAANIREYAAIVKDKALLRAISETASAINSMVFEQAGAASDILEAAEKRVFALRQGKNTQGLDRIASVMSGAFEQLRERAASTSGIPGLATGFPDLDSVILGLNKSDLIFIASRPGMGKTSFALNMALHTGKRSGKTVAVFSLEMSKEQLALRLLASEAYIDSKKLLTGRVASEDWVGLMTACDAISRTDIRINDNPSITVADMNAQCRRVENLGLVIIDYLQLMQSAGTGAGYAYENRTQAVSDISRMLKIMAKELNVPVVCLSQLNRSNEASRDKRPVLSSLRESGSIEQDADVVLGLYREDYYDKETENVNTAECIVLKNRHGGTGTIELQWYPEFTSFASRDTIHTE